MEEIGYSQVYPGVAIQSRGIELTAMELEELVELFKKIGKSVTKLGRGNERIYGVLNHFIAVKNDHAMYGPT